MDKRVLTETGPMTSERHELNRDDVTASRHAPGSAIQAVTSTYVTGFLRSQESLALCVPTPRFVLVRENVSQVSSESLTFKL